MSARSLTIEAVAFPDPQYKNLSDDEFDEVPANYSFIYKDSGRVRTLSTTNVPAHDIEALLYVPILPSSSSCNTTSFVPENATRRHNLPAGDFSLVAFSPWIDVQCTLDYLAAASSEAGIRAYLFYQPDDGTELPESMSSYVWGLGDGGAWKSQNQYPVYAIPGRSGREIMNALVDYSHNLTGVPHGHELADWYNPSDYVRLAIGIDTGARSKLPSLWIFLLVVLGILVITIGMTSALMHWMQRRRREHLRTRVENGEIDLEALGIKRLTVSQDVLDKMPLLVYTDGVTPDQSDHSPPLSPQRQHAGGIFTEPTSLPVDGFSTPDSTKGSAPAGSSTVSLHDQPTCAICLDDFVPHSTYVRQLPCSHIYHPNCIDTFLRENSSLCPLCKKSVLPKGYCPKDITNLMVRRVRAAERQRGNGDSSSSDGTNNEGSSSGLGRGWGLFDALPELFSITPDRQWRSPSPSHAAPSTVGGMQMTEQRPPVVNPAASNTLTSLTRAMAVESAPSGQPARNLSTPLSSPLSPASPVQRDAIPATTAFASTPAAHPPTADDYPVLSTPSPQPPETQQLTSATPRPEWTRQHALGFLSRRRADESDSQDQQQQQQQGTQEGHPRRGWRDVVQKIFPTGG